MKMSVNCRLQQWFILLMFSATHNQLCMCCGSHQNKTKLDGPNRNIAKIYVERMGNETLTNRSDALKVEGTGSEEDRGCDERTALRDIWKECEERGEQEQELGGVGYC